MNIEAEGGELVLQNNNGTIAIIKASDRSKALAALSIGNDSVIDDIIKSYPDEESFAEEGTVLDSDPLDIKFKARDTRGDFYSKFSTSGKSYLTVDDLDLLYEQEVEQLKKEEEVNGDIKSIATDMKSKGFIPVDFPDVKDIEGDFYPESSYSTPKPLPLKDQMELDSKHQKEIDITNEEINQVKSGMMEDQENYPDSYTGFRFSERAMERMARRFVNEKSEWEQNPIEKSASVTIDMGLDLIPAAFVTKIGTKSLKLVNRLKNLAVKYGDDNAKLITRLVKKVDNNTVNAVENAVDQSPDIDGIIKTIDDIDNNITLRRTKREINDLALLHYERTRGNIGLSVPSGQSRSQLFNSRHINNNRAYPISVNRQTVATNFSLDKARELTRGGYYEVMDKLFGETSSFQNLVDASRVSRQVSSLNPSLIRKEELNLLNSFDKLKDYDNQLRIVGEKVAEGGISPSKAIEEVKKIEREISEFSKGEGLMGLNSNDIIFNYSNILRNSHITPDIDVPPELDHLSRTMDKESYDKFRKISKWYNRGINDDFLVDENGVRKSVNEVLDLMIEDGIGLKDLENFKYYNGNNNIFFNRVTNIPPLKKKMRSSTAESNILDEIISTEYDDLSDESKGFADEMIEKVFIPDSWLLGPGMDIAEKRKALPRLLKMNEESIAPFARLYETNKAAAQALESLPDEYKTKDVNNLLPYLFLRAGKSSKNIDREIARAFKRFDMLSEGTVARSTGSLSVDSFTFGTMKMSRIKDAEFYIDGMLDLNHFGFLKDAKRDNHEIAAYINKTLEGITLNGKAIPKAHVNESGKVSIPNIVAVKKGGAILSIGAIMSLILSNANNDSEESKQI